MPELCESSWALTECPTAIITARHGFMQRDAAIIVGGATVGRFRSLVFSHDDLASESRFGRNLRGELAHWFPSTTWAAAFDRPAVRRALREDRRTFLLQLSVGTAGLLVPGLACSGVETAVAVGVVFQAIRVAQSEYSVGSESGGSASFGSTSQSREKAQLGTQLTLAASSEVVDENEEFVQVPAKADGWSYAFEGLMAAMAGDYMVAGTALGETLYTKVFKYL